MECNKQRVLINITILISSSPLLLACGFLPTKTIDSGTYDVRSSCPNAEENGQMSINMPNLGSNYSSFGFPNKVLSEEGSRPIRVISSNEVRTCTAFTVSDEYGTEFLFRCFESDFECSIYIKKG